MAAAFAAVALWGATPIATKVAVAGLDPLAVGMLRTLLAGILALPVILAARLPLPRGRSGLGLLAVSAAGGFVVFPVLFSLGLGLTSAAHGALILAILPVTTGLMAAAVERAWPGLRWWAGAGLAATGTFLLVGQRFGFASEGTSLQNAGLWGDLLVLASAFASSAGYVAGAWVAREVGTWAVTFWGLFLGSMVLLPLLFFVIAPAGLRQLDSSVWLSLLYLAGVSSILAYGA